jgi:Phage integrase family
MDPANVAKVFARILKAAKLPHFRVYDLRHTYASLLLSAGVPLLYVSQQLGHRKPTTTLRYYAKWIPSGDQRWVSTWTAMRGLPFARPEPGCRAAPRNALSWAGVRASGPRGPTPRGACAVRAAGH